MVLLLTPKKKAIPYEQVTLEAVHEKKIHPILLSDDLSWFDHIHTKSDIEEFCVVNTSFPAAGHYFALAIISL